MTGSALVTKHMQAYAGNYTKTRSRYGKITEITVHHCAGVMSVEDLGRLWQRVGREGSSHYGVARTTSPGQTAIGRPTAGPSPD